MAPPQQRGPNKRQIQAAETRERMLESAQIVFETRGYQAASVGAITRQAETAHGTFYLYFRNKDDAFAEVVSQVLRDMRDESRARLSGDRRRDLEGVIRAFIEVFTRHGGLWRALLEGMLLSDALEQIYRDAIGGFTDRIARRLRREQAAGAARADLDPQRSAEALADMAVWYAFRELVVTPSSADEVDAAVGTLTDLWYHAVYGGEA